MRGTMNPRLLWHTGDIMDVDITVARELLKNPGFVEVKPRPRPAKKKGEKRASKKR
jgi:hypothetical protein